MWVTGVIQNHSHAGHPPASCSWGQGFKSQQRHQLCWLKFMPANARILPWNRSLPCPSALWHFITSHGLLSISIVTFHYKPRSALHQHCDISLQATVCSPSALWHFITSHGLLSISIVTFHYKPRSALHQHCTAYVVVSEWIFFVIW
jgi:hypothetical protein